MTADTWWRTATVYQIYPRSFADSDGDGVGDLRGVISRLDHLVALGVGALWLSPVYPSPQDDNGYDISDYYDIDPMFGTLADFDELLREAHARGIRVVMDLVVNHTSDEHPWFVESRDPGSPKRDWYWWRPLPNNWGSRFSGPAWEFDDRSGEYYLHIFSRKQPDLNWENADLRQEIHRMMRWWLDRGVDGFRMDVINFISKPVGLPDAHLTDGTRYGDAEALYTNGPRLHDFLQEMHREVFAGREAVLLTVGETPGTSVDQARLLTDPSRRELDMIFQFDHVEIDQGRDKWDIRPLDLVALKRTFERWQHGLSDAGWNSLYWNNHDQPRIVSRWGDDTTYREESAKLLATVLHLHRGTPYVFQGEEIGMTNTRFRSIDDFADIQSRNYYTDAVTRRGEPADVVLDALRARSRDNGRTPMQWDDTENAGFSTGTPWLATNPNFVHINAAAQLHDPASVFAHYRALIALRRTEPLVTDGVFTLLLPDDPAIYAFTRTHAERGLLVLANFSSDAVAVPDGAMAGWPGSPLVIGNYPDSPPTLHRSVRLRPWESVVVRRGTG
ncbi:glycoside hydrolase family 13 protein [Pseudonocardia alaniniphila]|uniref:Alpha-glucosidase n=1 Tax=Pseudonocardia alaniniphila TaxID=75291 RepID=A0ABS9TP40_9PSEU|nr:alpha-glucosidase [Pseudonocardia alaniniphila]MCH6170158.1 alpha-glucosidase [Pseudonocardia alaniniphila]